MRGAWAVTVWESVEGVLTACWMGVGWRAPQGRRAVRRGPEAVPCQENDLLGWFEKRVDPFPQADPELPPGKLWPFLWFCSKGMRIHIAGVVALTALVGAFEAYLFSALGRVVDWLSAAEKASFFKREGSELWLLLGIMLASVLAVAVQTWIKRQTLSGSFPMRLRWNFHRLMLGQSLSFYQDEFAGREAAKVMQTALAARDAWMILADIMVFVVIYFATMGWILGGFGSALLYPFLAWLVLYALSIWHFVPRLGASSERQSHARSTMAGRMTDAYANISTVKLFSHSKREAGYARESMASFLGTVNEQMRLVSAMEIVNHALSILLIVGTGGSALWMWSEGVLGIGAVAAATAMAIRLNGISHWIMWEMSSLFENLGTARDGLDCLSKARSVVDRPGAPNLEPGAGGIEFEDVSFGYGGKRMVLSHLSLRIKPGEKVGLVGRSGAGKSTILNLLLRFYDPDGGRVLVDGQDVASVAQESLRARVGMVTQDTALLHRSVRDNIMYGRPDAGEDEMVAAAEAAHADGFIAGLGDAHGRRGYDAQVGERGVKLSGGQRQRVAIARVMLKNAPILLLDEATSALDSEVEAAIQESLSSLMRGKTVVAIAHRLSTIAAMDRLVVLDAGRVAEEGSHAELLALGGIYASLWARQVGGFLAEGDEDPAVPASLGDGDEDGELGSRA